jgi:Zn finger protein HypA/HybF involved in hydrogenase expression
MMKTQLIIVGSLGLCLWMSPLASGQKEDPAKLIGTKKCAMCHKKAEDGDQFGKWQAAKHSKAFEVLASDKAKAVAAKLNIENPQTSGKCLKCHSTAYYFTEELKSEAVELADGVSCESCHGPGDDYKKKSIMEDHDAAVAAGMVYPAKNRCVLCHNEENPTWNPELYTLENGEKTGFDLKQAYEKMKHERPAPAEAAATE